MRNLLAAGLLLLLAGVARAAGSNTFNPDPTYWDQGTAPIGFNTSCVSGGWGLIKSSDTINRGTIYQADATNAGPICIVTSSLGTAVTCSSSVLGLILGTGVSWTDYSHASYYCRAQTGGTPAVLHGIEYRDRGDYGNIGLANQ